MTNKKSEVKIQDDLLDQVNDRVKGEKKITELTGMTGKILKGAGGVLKKIGINVGSDTFDKPYIISEFNFGALDSGKFYPGLGYASDQRNRGEKYGLFRILILGKQSIWTVISRSL